MDAKIKSLSIFFFTLFLYTSSIQAFPYSYSADTIYFNVTPTAERVRSAQIVKDGMPIVGIETDTDLRLEYQIIDRNSFAIKADSLRRVAQYQFIYCSVSPLPASYDRYLMRTKYKKCPDVWDYQYNLSYLQAGLKYVFPIPKLLNGQNTFMWSAGAGDDGGGGLPTCDNLDIEGWINQSNTYINSNFEFIGDGFSRGESAGCSITSLQFQENTTSGWKNIITSGNGTLMNTNCTGVSCQIAPAVVNQIYYRNITCNKVGNKPYRVNLLGTIQFESVERNSSTLYQRCTAKTCRCNMEYCDDQKHFNVSKPTDCINENLKINISINVRINPYLSFYNIPDVSTATLNLYNTNITTERTYTTKTQRYDGTYPDCYISLNSSKIEYMDI